MHELTLTVDGYRPPGSWWWVLAEPSGREIARSAVDLDVDQSQAGVLGPLVGELMSRRPVVVRAAGGPQPLLDLLGRSFAAARVDGRSLAEHGITLIVQPDEWRAVAGMGDVCRECGRLDGRHASWCSRA